MSTSKRTTKPDHDKEAPSWSEAAKEQTRQLIDDGTFVPLDDKLHLKRIGSSFGYIAFQDLTNGALKVVDKRSGEVRVFSDVDELMRDGWVVD